MSDDAGSQQQPISRGRGLGRPFVPGQSGNPGGRPKGIEARAREHTDRALETLVQALEDPDRRVAITAAGILLDRGWGKAKQTLAADPENPVQWVVRMPEPCASVEEWLQRYVPAELARQREQAVIDGEAEPTTPELPALEPPEPKRAPPAPAASAPAPAQSRDAAIASWLSEFNRSDGYR